MRNGQRQRDRDSHARRNTIGLTHAEIEDLLERMDMITNPSEHAAARTSVRWPLSGATADLEIEDNGNFRPRIPVVGRNISDTGCSLLHSSFFYPGTACRVWLHPREYGQRLVPTTGRIVRCVHVEGVVHELGIRFDECLDSSAYVSKLLSVEDCPEIRITSQMSGRVLHVDDSDTDRALVAYLLKETSIQLVAAQSLRHAKSLLEAPFDLILCDVMLPDGQGIDLVQWMRDRGITTPVAIHSAVPASQVRERMHESEVQGYLPKPVHQRTLLTAMMEFLSPPKRKKPEKPTCALDLSRPEIMQIVRTFKNELQELVGQIESAVANEDAMGAYALTLRLQGSAPVLGFEQMSHIAERAGESLAATMSCEESSPQIQALLECCRQVYSG